MLKLFYTKVSDLPDTAEGLILSEYRAEKIKKLAHSEKRRQAIGAELLLNYGVGRIFPELSAPFEIDTCEFGKPFFKNVPLYFSLSHSGEFAACALSDLPVGLDIELRAKYNPALVKRFFSQDEQLLLQQSTEKDYEFARMWTAKESALKYLGSGLNRSLASVLVSEGNSIRVEPEGIELKLFYNCVDSFHVSICALNEAEPDEFSFVNFI